MTNIFKPASADASARADVPCTDEAPDQAKARQRAIIEAQLAKKKGGGDAHGPQHDREGRAGKAKSQTSFQPVRPGQRRGRG